MSPHAAHQCAHIVIAKLHEDSLGLQCRYMVMSMVLNRAAGEALLSLPEGSASAQDEGQVWPQALKSLSISCIAIRCSVSELNRGESWSVSWSENHQPFCVSRTAMHVPASGVVSRAARYLI